MSRKRTKNDRRTRKKKNLEKALKRKRQKPKRRLVNITKWAGSIVLIFALYQVFDYVRPKPLLITANDPARKSELLPEHFSVKNQNAFFDVDVDYVHCDTDFNVPSTDGGIAQIRNFPTTRTSAMNFTLPEDAEKPFNCGAGYVGVTNIVVRMKSRYRLTLFPFITNESETTFVWNGHLGKWLQHYGARLP